ncbi:MAG: phage integrase N-terminal SAM-like domain-containing protein [Gammaproteobacteria bacterium]
MTSLPFDEHGVDRNPWLLDEVRAKIRTLHYSRRTEKSYTQWIKRSMRWPNSSVAVTAMYTGT